MLYRLLFALYAEDRELLPARDVRFDDNALSPIRDEIASRLDRSDAMTNRSTRYWDHCIALFRIVDEGDTDLGIPPYNGGLFASARAPLVETVRIGDAIFAPLFDMLSRTQKGDRKVRINFRDLSVRELGAIYEGLLEHRAGRRPRRGAGHRGAAEPFQPQDLGQLLHARRTGDADHRADGRPAGQRSPRGLRADSADGWRAIRDLSGPARRASGCRSGNRNSRVANLRPGYGFGALPRQPDRFSRRCGLHRDWREPLPVSPGPNTSRRSCSGWRHPRPHRSRRRPRTTGRSAPSS